MTAFDNLTDLATNLDRYGQLEAAVEEASTYVEQLEATLRDFAEHGLRVDLAPTVQSEIGYSWWAHYLRLADQNVRQRAARALLRGEA